MQSLPECIVWVTVGLTECFAIVTLNAIAIFVFIKNRNLRKRSMYLVINLLVVDMLTGAVAINDLVQNVGAYQCKLWNNQQPKSSATIYILTTMLRLFPVASITNVAAISVERLHATLRPFKHRVLKKKVYGLTIALVWVTAGLLAIALNYYFHNSYLLDAFYSVCLFMICVSYSSIIIKVRCGAQPQHHGAASRERNLTMTLLIVTVVSLLLYLPYIIINSFIFMSSVSISIYLHLLRVTVVLFYANSLVNPILYTIRMPEFRPAVLALFRRRSQQQRQVEVLPLRDL